MKDFLTILLVVVLVASPLAGFFTWFIFKDRADKFHDDDDDDDDFPPMMFI